MIIGATFSFTEKLMKREPLERLRRGGLKKSVMREKKGRSATILPREVTILTRESRMMIGEKAT